VLTEQIFRNDSELTQIAFSRLLDWLDDGVASNGARYLEIRQRLVSYFDRRNCPDSDALADETFTRIGRTLEKEGVILTRPPARYCYVVARFVLLEDVRRQRKHVHLYHSLMIDAPRASKFLRRGSRDDTSVVREHQIDCLDHCLQKLAPDQRELVVDYYRDSHRQKIDHRREIACRLGITMNALGIRVYRIREALTACLERCGTGLRRRPIAPPRPGMS